MKIFKKTLAIYFFINVFIHQLILFYLFMSNNPSDSSNVKDKVRNIIIQHLGIDSNRLLDDSSLKDTAGADSLDAVEIIMAVETDFDIEIPDNEAEKMTSVNAIVQYVESKIK